MRLYIMYANLETTLAKTSGPTPSGCEQQQCPAKPGQDHCAPEPPILAHVRPKHPMAMVANGHEQERETPMRSNKAAQVFIGNA